MQIWRPFGAAIFLAAGHPLDACHEGTRRRRAIWAIGVVTAKAL